MANDFRCRVRKQTTFSNVEVVVFEDEVWWVVVEDGGNMFTWKRICKRCNVSEEQRSLFNVSVTRDDTIDALDSRNEVTLLQTSLSSVG
jgi:hypothetical protein